MNEINTFPNIKPSLNSWEDDLFQETVLSFSQHFCPSGDHTWRFYIIYFKVAERVDLKCSHHKKKKKLRLHEMTEGFN